MNSRYTLIGFLMFLAGMGSSAKAFILNEQKIYRETCDLKVNKTLKKRFTFHFSLYPCDAGLSEDTGICVEPRSPLVSASFELGRYRQADGSVIVSSAQVDTDSSGNSIGDLVPKTHFGSLDQRNLGLHFRICDNIDGQFPNCPEHPLHPIGDANWKFSASRAKASRRGGTIIFGRWRERWTKPELKTTVTFSCSAY